jgi:ABC-type antimicrobial peptide transport system permease subunit
VVGLYGVIAYSVTQRAKEIGIRKALGAQRRNILANVVGHGLRLVLSGLLFGMCGAFALTRVLHGLLFQVSPTDPATYISVSHFCLWRWPWQQAISLHGGRLLSILWLRSELEGHAPKVSHVLAVSDGTARPVRAR